MSDEIEYHEHEWSDWTPVAFVENKPVAWIRSCPRCFKVESMNEDIDLSWLTV